MKLNKFTAVGATLALAVGSVVGIGAAAYAIDVPIDEITVEGDTYPAGQWFLGSPVGPELSQDETGLTIPGRNQLLYGWSFTGAEGAGTTTAEFTALIEGASFEATGDATFQVPVFFDPEDTVINEGDALVFTTLRPATTGSPLTSTDWISSRALPAFGIAANTPVPFADIAALFDEAIELGAAPEILAFGILVDEGATVLLNSVTFAGETWTFATPVDPVDPPVEPVDPPAEVPTPIQDPATFTG
ncbi:hypothetical protein [Microbacterium sp. CFBP9034]|uniref:hypothetical protein n=1 Tax=Microbacterium sp. CFBP9034 TaxID=3096540 RepID=UPI002A6A3E86|nr:hypothetical protein [Microbacterium sp. CFBP9034]MDY0909687.1 hypothetical protein [Microbacterium sp. CFBP9034]